MTEDEQQPEFTVTDKRRIGRSEAVDQIARIKGSKKLVAQPVDESFGEAVQRQIRDGIDVPSSKGPQPGVNWSIEAELPIPSPAPLPENAPEGQPESGFLPKQAENSETCQIGQFDNCEETDVPQADDQPQSIWEAIGVPADAFIVGEGILMDEGTRWVEVDALEAALANFLPHIFGEAMTDADGNVLTSLPLGLFLEKPFRALEVWVHVMSYYRVPVMAQLFFLALAKASGGNWASVVKYPTVERKMYEIGKRTGLQIGSAEVVSSAENVH